MSRTSLILLAIATAFAPMALAAPPAPVQDDGGSGDDASNVCSGDLVVLQIDGDGLTGELYPPHDSDDFYALEVDSDDVGNEFTVQLNGHHDMTLDVFMPDCGRNVVPTSPNGDNGGGGTGGSWHVHDDGAGHDHCDVAGHAADAGCDTEQGSEDGFGAVTFTPTQEGHYYAQVSISPSAERGGGPPGKRWPPGDEFTVASCHLGCMSYTLTSAASGDTQID